MTTLIKILLNIIVILPFLVLTEEEHQHSCNNSHVANLKKVFGTMVVSTRQRTLQLVEEEEEAPSQQQQQKQDIETTSSDSEDATHAPIDSTNQLIDSIADIFEKTSGEHVHRNMVWKPEISLPSSRKQHEENEETFLDKHGNAYQTLDTMSRKKKPEKNASKEWFNLPTQEISDDVKTELRVLRLRSAFDPKQFYKKFDETKFPSKFQFGRVVESSADFYSSRLTNKQRKRTMAEEIMSDPHLTHVRKKRYSALQQEKAGTSYFSRKTKNPRIKKKAKRSKH